MNDKATVGSAPFGARAVEWISRESDPSFPPIDPAVQMLLSTSGTTGSQKYVRLSRDAVVANARQIAQALAIDGRSVGIAHLPLHYSYGLSVVTSHLTAGGRLCLINDSITSQSFWSKIASVGGSHFPGVPFHYVALARLGAGLVPDSVKTFTQAGGALDLRVQTKIRDWATQRGGRFFVMYGQTEAAPRMATLHHADHARKAGSVGVALDGGRFSIVDESGAPAPADVVGTVVYEGPNVMQGYAVSRADLGKGDEMNGRPRNRRPWTTGRGGVSLPDRTNQAFRQDRRISPWSRRDRKGTVRRLPRRLPRSGRKNRSRARTGVRDGAQGSGPRARRQLQGTLLELRATEDHANPTRFERQDRLCATEGSRECLSASSTSRPIRSSKPTKSRFCSRD